MEEFVAVIGVEIASAGGRRIKLNGGFLGIVIRQVVGRCFSNSGVSEMLGDLVIFIVAV